MMPIKDHEYARMVELADTQASNPCASSRTGSTPVTGTTLESSSAEDVLSEESKRRMG